MPITTNKIIKIKGITGSFKVPPRHPKEALALEVLAALALALALAALAALAVLALGLALGLVPRILHAS